MGKQLQSVVQLKVLNYDGWKVPKAVSFKSTNLITNIYIYKGVNAGSNVKKTKQKQF